MPRYWPYYCEENIWWLAHERDAADGAALFVTGTGAPPAPGSGSAETRRVLMAAQRAGDGEHGVVGWDYHVVWTERNGRQWTVFDADSLLPGAAEGVTLERWLTASFPPLKPAYMQFAPRFRLLPGDEFLRAFASDRRHMRGAQGRWLKPPPPWPPIGVGHTLNELLDMRRATPGAVLGLAELRERLADAHDV